MKTIERLLLPDKLIRGLDKQFDVAGIKLSMSKLLITVLIVDFVITFLTLIFFRDLFQYYKGINVLISFLSYFAMIFFGILIIFSVFFYGWIVYKKVKRRTEIEDILPDYLELVAANVGAGMTIDQALWYAIREKFGVLATEMEMVAKKIMAGSDLDKALYEFTGKYDSKVLEKSFILLVESLESGGKIAELITKIAWNIKENQIMKKEIAGNVAMYSLFIGFASLVAAPVLYALSHRIIIIMSSIIGNIDLSSATTIDTKLPISSIGKGISASSFKIFAFIMLFITSLSSAMIVSTVKKGSIKEGLKLLPVYVAISITLFLIASVVLSSLFNSIGL